uniref:NAC domain-containing protein n=1 Tax=Oryza punctata TaxID=4537 RepID=A0A0E0KKL7_ORYPU
MATSTKHLLPSQSKITFPSSPAAASSRDAPPRRPSRTRLAWPRKQAIPWRLPAPAHSAPLAATSGNNQAVVPDALPQEPAKRRPNYNRSRHYCPTQRCRQPRRRQPEQENNMDEAVAAGGEPPATSALAIIPRHDDVNQQDEVEAAGGDAGRPVFPYSDVPGVRFTPTDQELIVHFLKPKYILRDDMPTNIIKSLDVCKLNLDKLHGDLGLGESMYGAWYVFSPRNRYKEHAVRPARGIKTTTVVGGIPEVEQRGGQRRRRQRRDSQLISRVNTLMLALSHQPKGKATHWRMKEYRIPQFHIPLGQDSNRLLDEWLLCKLVNARFMKRAANQMKVYKTEFSLLSLNGD